MTGPSRDGDVLICPVCGYPNDPGEWRCRGTIQVRGDKERCGKDLTDEEPTASREDLAVNRPGGSA